MNLFDLEIAIRAEEANAKLLNIQDGNRQLLLGKKEWKLLPPEAKESNMYMGLPVKRSGFESLIIVVEVEDDV